MKKYFYVISIPFFVAACGGGGGGSTAPASTAPVASTDTFQLQKAYVNYVTDSSSRSFSISGISSGKSLSGTGRVTSGSLASATFEGQSVLAKTQVVTGTRIEAGTSTPLSSSATTYVDSAYKLVGRTDTEYMLVTSFSMLSDLSKVNATGSYYSAIRYTNSTKSSVIGTRTATYALEPDTASTALLKFILVDKDSNGNSTSTGTVSFRVTPSGALTPISETSTSTSSGETITITY
jgi:hypothetical protein